MVQDKIPEGFEPWGVKDILVPKEFISWKAIVRAVAFLLLAGVLVDWAVLFHVLGWSALAREAGGRCGSGGIGLRPCPRGMAPVLLLAFLWTFAGIGTLGAAAAFAGKAWRRRRLLSCSVFAAGVVLGTAPGLAGYHWLRTGEWKVSAAGPKQPPAPATLHKLWAAPADRPSTVRSEGHWTTADGAVVRVRTDRATAFDAATGAVRWTFPFPGEDALCSMSRDVADGVGLLSYALDGEKCAGVVAVDTTTGKELWHTDRVTDDEATGSGVTIDVLSAAPGVAVLAENADLKGLDLRTGHPLWQTPIDSGCVATGTLAAKTATLVGIDCGDAGRRVLSLNTTTGKQLWQANPPFSGKWKTGPEFLSADPAVVRLDEIGSRGQDVIVSYDATGKQRAAISVSGPDEDVADTVLQAAVSPPFVVSADTLVVPVTVPGAASAGRISGYSLATGQRLWTVDPRAGSTRTGSESVFGVAPDGGAVAVATGKRLLRLDVTTGKVLGSYLNATTSMSPWPDDALAAVGGHYVYLSEDGTGRTPPIAAAAP
ncbi:PQQ-binding-like beta-propeller repeat protein [Catenulispora subtropica]|uniref:outer membrane protein assembly factor BamB family protein n=1 Tax=Catenulispora subtropica TaxID=450798 RepID=UPI0031D97299